MARRERSLDQQRNRIKSQYRRGRKTEKRIVGEAALTEVELANKKMMACVLKAADFSYTYIGDAVSMSKDTVRRWFADDPVMAETVEEIQASFVDGAVRLLKTYAVEAVEMLMELARSTEDDKVALQAITEVLDRIGLSKVNKSESIAAVTKRDVVDITDSSGLVEKLRNAPPEVQAQAAEHMEATLALMAEHTDGDVTHG